MKELESLLNDIEKLRALLIKLIEEKNDLQDPEVITASQNLNQAIVKYQELLTMKSK